ncbi:MAG: D-lyxose/D-mannose family sugar isomerase [Pseudomonadota bacterium]
MKRSEINAIIRDADVFIQSFGFRLPPFAYWSPEEMQANAATATHLKAARLGWDITDYGAGDFERMGLFLFTTRNGLPGGAVTDGICYAEKIMISRHDQISPMHRHLMKTEDIINRGGATLAIEMFESAADGALDPDAPVTVMTDGQQRRLNPGDILKLSPGESVTLKPGNWHKFWGEGGDVLIGEVSSVNDDETDNVFVDPIGRFAAIEEDEPPVHLLVSDYDRWLAQ